MERHQPRESGFGFGRSEVLGVQRPVNLPGGAVIPSMGHLRYNGGELLGESSELPGTEGH